MLIFGKETPTSVKFPEGRRKQGKTTWENVKRATLQCRSCLRTHFIAVYLCQTEYVIRIKYGNHDELNCELK